MENITAGGSGSLVDIRDVTVDKELPREERITEFVRQIKNPYRFKCGRFTVRASFAPWRCHPGGMYQGYFTVKQNFFQKRADFPVRAWYNKSRKRN